MVVSLDGGSGNDRDGGRELAAVQTDGSLIIYDRDHTEAWLEMDTDATVQVGGTNE